MTRLPTTKSLTADPTATTVPEPSWEAMRGSLEPKVPCWTMPSVWQFDATPTFTRMSLGASDLGTGTVFSL